MAVHTGKETDHSSSGCVVVWCTANCAEAGVRWNHNVISGRMDPSLGSHHHRNTRKDPMWRPLFPGSVPMSTEFPTHGCYLHFQPFQRQRQLLCQLSNRVSLVISLLTVHLFVSLILLFRLESCILLLCFFLLTTSLLLLPATP